MCECVCVLAFAGLCVCVCECVRGDAQTGKTLNQSEAYIPI